MIIYIYSHSQGGQEGEPENRIWTVPYEPCKGARKKNGFKKKKKCPLKKNHIQRKLQTGKDTF